MVMVCTRCRRTAAKEHFCKTCDRCKRECQGDCGGPGHGETKYRAARMKIEGERFVKNTLRRGIGVEIEAGVWKEGMRAITGAGIAGMTVHDGSVLPSGREFVVYPMRGDKLVEALVKIAGILNEEHVEMNDTCGYHVHVDGEDMSWWNMRGVLTGYLVCEEEIYGLCDPVRRKSTFCKKLGPDAWEHVNRMWGAVSTTEIKACLVEWLYAQDLPVGKEEAERFIERTQSKVIDGYNRGRSFVRYVGLNPHSWMHRGTLEWRMKEGTKDAGDVVMWPLFCGWFVEVMAGMGDKEIGTVRGLGDVVRKMPVGVREWVEEAKRRRAN